jgi:hypothetical protein
VSSCVVSRNSANIGVASDDRAPSLPWYAMQIRHKRSPTQLFLPPGSAIATNLLDWARSVIGLKTGSNFARYVWPNLTRLVRRRNIPSVARHIDLAQTAKLERLPWIGADIVGSALEHDSEQHFN